MFAIVPKAVIASQNISPVAKAVFASLAVRCNQETGFAFPHRQTIARELGIHVDSVSRATRQLEDAGFISKSRNDGGRNQSAIYFLVADVDQNRGKLGQVSINPNSDRAVRGKDQTESKQEITTENLPTVNCGYGFSSFQDQDTGVVSPTSLAIEDQDTGVVSPTSLAIEDQDIALVPDLQFSENERKPLQATVADENDITTILITPPLPQAILASILTLLVALPPAIAQVLLDELAENMKIREVYSPIAYVRKLIHLVRSGTFIPELAHLAVAGRQAESRYQRLLNNPPPIPINPDKPIINKNEIKNNISNLRNIIFGIK